MQGGAAYIIFGHASPYQTMSDLYFFLDGTNGFVFYGGSDREMLGVGVGSAGDFNHDGYPDVIIGAWGSSPKGRANAGSAVVIFGKKL